MPGMRKIGKNLRHDYFHTIDTEEKAYWLGFIVGDGSIRVTNGIENALTFGINKKDEYHLDKFLNTIKWSGTKWYSSKNDCVHVQIYSKEMCKDLKALNITARKSLTATLPKIADELKIHLIRGIFDADGYVTRGRIPYNYPIVGIVGSFECLKDIHSFLQFKTKIHKHGNIWKITVAGADAKEAFNLLYSSATISLDRKRLKAEKLCGSTFGR